MIYRRIYPEGMLAILWREKLPPPLRKCAFLPDREATLRMIDFERYGTYGHRIFLGLVRRDEDDCRAWQIRGELAAQMRIERLKQQRRDFERNFVGPSLSRERWRALQDERSKPQREARELRRRQWAYIRIHAILRRFYVMRRYAQGASIPEIAKELGARRARIYADWYSNCYGFVVAGSDPAMSREEAVASIRAADERWGARP